MKNTLRRLVDFYWGAGIADDVPALTYYLMLSLAPFALGLTALTTIFFGDKLSLTVVADEITRYLPRSIEGDVVDLVITTKRDSPQLLLLAIATMIWTTSGAISIIERCMTRMLGKDPYSFWLGRLRNFAIGAGLGILVIFSVAATSVAVGLSDYLPFPAQTVTRFFAVLNFVGSALICALIYRFASHHCIGWRAAFSGAIPAAVVLQVAPLFVGLYFSLFARFGTASIFLSLTIVLFACFVIAQGFLVGAGIASRAHLRFFT